MQAIGGVNEKIEGFFDACEIAVARSITWLEDNACFSRRGHNGVEHVYGDGYVAARHLKSRGWNVIRAPKFFASAIA